MINEDIDKDKFYLIEKDGIKSLMREMKRELLSNIPKLRDTDDNIRYRALRGIEDFSIKLQLLTQIFKL